MTDVPSAAHSAAKAPAWQRRKAFRKDEILAAAVEVLEEHGPEQISVLEIAARASVSEATIYKYFESKNNLLDLAITAALEPMVAFLENEIPRIQGTEMKVRFLIVRSMLDMIERPKTARAIYGELRWARRVDTIKDLHRRLGVVVRRIFEDGVASGELSPDTDPLLTGDMVFGGLASTGWRTLLSGRDVPDGIEGFASRFARQIMVGVARKPEVQDEELMARLRKLVGQLDDTAG